MSIFLNILAVASNALAQWFVIVFFSRKYSLEIVGEYSYWLALITPIQILTSLQLRNFYNSLDDNHDINHRLIFKIRAYSSILYLIISLCVGFILIEMNQIFIFVILVFAKYFEQMSEVTHAIKQKENNLFHVAISMILKSVLLITLLFTLGEFLHNKTYVYTVILLVSISAFVFDLLYSKKDIQNQSKKTNPNSLKEIIKKTIPLAIAASALAININLPRYVLKIITNEETIGVFTSIFFFYASFLVIANAAIQAKINTVAAKYVLKSDFKKLLKYSLKTYILTTIILIVGTLTLGSSLYIIIYGEKNINATTYLYHLAYLLPLGLLGTFFNYLTTATKHYKNVMRASYISLVSHIPLSFILTAQFGLDGTFMALGISSLTSIIYFALVHKKDYRERKE